MTYPVFSPEPLLMPLLTKFKAITTIALDMDGVLTDGSLLVFEDSRFLRTMNIKDGYALQLAVKKGFQVLIISGSHSDAVTTRLQGLGITNIFMKQSDKKACLTEYMKENNIRPEQVLFMGDDIPDFQVMKAVGLACAPNDAAEEIKSIAHYISPYCGGKGCVRDVIEKVLKMNGAWELETGIASK